MIANKVSRNLGVLNKIKHLLPQHIMKTLYCSMIQSHFNYTILAWGHESHRIEQLQKTAVKVITACKYNAHTDPIFRSLNLLKIADIFKLHSLKFYYNHVHHELPHYFQAFDFSTNHDVHNYETRQGHHIPANITRTRMAQRCVRHNVSKVVNSTDQNIMQSINITCVKGFDMLIKNNLIKSYQTECWLLTTTSATGKLHFSLLILLNNVT